VISAVAFVLAGLVVFMGPAGRRRRRMRNIQEGIWVTRSSKAETAQAA
jgi:hypothetical protein